MTPYERMPHIKYAPDTGGEDNCGVNGEKRRKRSALFGDKVERVDYKDVGRLRKFITERGKILPRRISGNCARHQRQMTVAIKRARHVALLPFTSD